MNSNNLPLNSLTALSSIDGRYGRKTAELRNYLSEYSLFKHRLIVELMYFKDLCKILPQLKGVPKFFLDSFDAIIRNFSVENAQKMKDFEKTTNHDVKAVEYFIRELFKEHGMEKYLEFIHFALTSYDINSPSVNMMVSKALRSSIIPELDHLIMIMSDLSNNWKDIPMLAHTHGQPASPTKLGKEIRVFIERLTKLHAQLLDYIFEAKFGGATGNFNAHYVAYPKIDWHTWADEFLLEEFGLVRQQTTTQIESYDNLAELFDILKRINTVFIDLSRDMWMYISMGYFSQKVKKDEVGSSAMPHKVNPIDLENAEGNSGIARDSFIHLANKLSISRLQRDLSGSTVERTIGVPFAHTLIAISAIQNAFGKVDPNIKKINYDLENNWAVIAEGIQTILRRENYPDPYGALKELTRTGENEMITKEIIHKWIDLLGISDPIKSELKTLTPYNYTGVCK